VERVDCMVGVQQGAGRLFVYAIRVLQIMIMVAQGANMQMCEVFVCSLKQATWVTRRPMSCGIVPLSTLGGLRWVVV
jgi:hypothetical protein